MPSNNCKRSMAVGEDEDIRDGIERDEWLREACAYHRERLYRIERIAWRLDSMRRISPYEEQPYVDRDYGRIGPEERIE